MAYKLEPCPCCHELPVIFHARTPEGESRGFFVACDNCDCENLPETDRFPTEEEAANDWNTFAKEAKYAAD